MGVSFQVVAQVTYATARINVHAKRSGRVVLLICLAVTQPISYAVKRTNALSVRQMEVSAVKILVCAAPISPVQGFLLVQVLMLTYV